MNRHIVELHCSDTVGKHSIHPPIATPPSAHFTSHFHVHCSGLDRRELLLVNENVNNPVKHYFCPPIAMYSSADCTSRYSIHPPVSIPQSAEQYSIRYYTPFYNTNAINCASFSPHVIVSIESYYIPLTIPAISKKLAVQFLR